jgi:phage/plasmid-associated DNA primase
MRGSQKLRDEERAQKLANGPDVPLNLAQQFIDESCSVQKEVFVYFTPLYKAFVKFAASKGKLPLTFQNFGNKLTQMGYPKQTRKNGYLIYRGINSLGMMKRVVGRAE